MTRNMTLLTDLYEITMAQSYWSQGKIDTDACFYSFYRDNPFGGGYGVFCGANQIAELVDGFGFTDDDIEYLASLQSPGKTPLFDPAFLAWLRGIELSVDICTASFSSPPSSTASTSRRSSRPRHLAYVRRPRGAPSRSSGCVARRGLTVPSRHREPPMLAVARRLPTCSRESSTIFP